MSEKLESAFERLQTLEIMPTVSNMEILLQSLYDIREVYQELVRNGDENNGSTADTE